MDSISTTFTPLYLGQDYLDSNGAESTLHSFKLYEDTYQTECASCDMLTPDVYYRDRIIGKIRANINNTWTTIIAVGDIAEVRFYSDYTTANTYTEIDPSFTWTTDYDVKFAELNGNVVGVNGLDKPLIIYYSGGVVIENLEDYDERVRTTDDWYAGQYDASETNPYIDDTTDAQSTDANDFILATTTNGDGFYISGVLTFNKVVIKNAPQFDGSPVAVYEYYNGTTWANLTLATTPSWTAAAGDKTIEFDYPQDWSVWDGAEASDGAAGTVSGALFGRFLIRVRFTTAPTSQQVADYFEISHAQYLTQITGGDIFTEVESHRGRIFLASGRVVNYSPINRLTGWNEYDLEYFGEGGTSINRLFSYNEFLTIFKNDAIYGLFGNSYENWNVRKLSSKGTANGNSVALGGDMLFYLGQDNVIWGFNGDQAKRMTKHIQSEIASLESTQCWGYTYEGDYYLSFPGNSTIIWFDPDSFRQDERGEGMMAVWKYTGIQAKNIKWQEDTGTLIGVYEDKIYQLENGNSYDGTDTAIEIEAKTKEYSFGATQLIKRVHRVKPEVSCSGDWTFTVYGEHERANTEVTLESGTANTFFTTDITVPYTIDGKLISFKFGNETINPAKIHGVAIDISSRRY